MSKNKAEILESLEKSKTLIKELSRNKSISKKESSKIIENILEMENETIQKIIALTYIEKLNSKEISWILNIHEIEVLYYIEYIIWKIHLLLLNNCNNTNKNITNTNNTPKNLNQNKYILDIKI